MRIRLIQAVTAAALLLAIAIAAPARAQPVTVDFTYSNGSSVSFFDPGAVASGSGSFTTDSTGSTLTAFSFILSFTYGGYTDNFTYGLADVTSFAAVYSGGTVTDLTLNTDVEPATYNWNQFFVVRAVGTGGGGSGNFDTGVLSVGDISAVETTPPVSVPEPASMSLMALGLAALGAARHRFKRGCLRHG